MDCHLSSYLDHASHPFIIGTLLFVYLHLLAVTDLEGFESPLKAVRGAQVLYSHHFHSQSASECEFCSASQSQNSSRRRRRGGGRRRRCVRRYCSQGETAALHELQERGTNAVCSDRLQLLSVHSLAYSAALSVTNPIMLLINPSPQSIYSLMC